MEIYAWSLSFNRFSSYDIISTFLYIKEKFHK